jgi:hypothetical protein
MMTRLMKMAPKRKGRRKVVSSQTKMIFRKLMSVSNQMLMRSSGSTMTRLKRIATVSKSLQKSKNQKMMSWSNALPKLKATRARLRRQASRSTLLTKSSPTYLTKAWKPLKTTRKRKSTSLAPWHPAGAEAAEAVGEAPHTREHVIETDCVVN